MSDFEKTPANNQNVKSNANTVESTEEHGSVGFYPPPLQFATSGGDVSQSQSQGSISNGNLVIQRSGDDAETATQNTINAASQARTIHEAVDGLGTDEAAIFRTLAGLSREQVKLLKRTYQSVYGNTLMTDLRDDLTDDELRTALIFMHYWPVQYGNVLGTYQRDQAYEKILELPGYSLNTFTNLLDIQTTYEHRAYVAKALAAGNTILDIIPFAYEISRHDHEWMENNLRLTRQSDGRGVQQSWQHSCGPTTVQALQGELDPIYALNVRRNTPDIDQGNGVATGPNTEVATDQQDMLEGAGGIAVPRGASGGRWMNMNDLVDYVEERTGIEYNVVYGANDQGAAMDVIDGILGQGLPVPIRIANADNSGGHFVLITNKSGTSYNIHDVWDGNSHSRTREDFTTDNMNIANLTSFRHYGRPD